MKIKSPHFKKQYDLSKAQHIGQGNFAQVYRIFDEELKDSLAIRKVNKNQSDIEDITKEKIINEELRKVDNQNILKIYDIIDTEQAVWYITQYCSGGSLWDVLNFCKDNKMNEKDCLQCVLQISKGVQELHNHRITHRDLKPQNILLKTKYVPNKQLPLVKLADFGLSTQKIIMQTIAGTKQYIAPEQAKFHNYTNAVDVWSLGIICDQILHGTPFYSGQNNKEVFNKILKLPYKVRDDSIRISIKNLLTSLLKKKPYQRPIIAVIRKTIQKILEQIQSCKQSKGQKIIKKNSEPTHKDNDDSFQSSNQSLNNFSKLSRHHVLGLQSRKVAQTKRQKQRQSVNANQNSFYKKQIYTPLNKSSKPITPRVQLGATDRDISQKKYQSAQKQQNKEKKFISPRTEKTQKQDNEINAVKVQKTASKTKITESKDKTSESKDKTTESKEKTSELKDKTTQLKDLDDQKSQYKAQKSVQTFQIKQSSVFDRKIPIYKHQMKKPATKKDELKKQLVDVKSYIQDLLIKKKNISEISIKIQKSNSFIPNTHLNTSQLQKIDKQSISQILSKFKKQYDLLNYVQYNDDYDIKIYKKSKDLQLKKQEAIIQMKEIKENIKQKFLKQIDCYVELFLQKNLK